MSPPHPSGMMIGCIHFIVLVSNIVLAFNVFTHDAHGRSVWTDREGQKISQGCLKGRKKPVWTLRFSPEAGWGSYVQELQQRTQKVEK